MAAPLDSDNIARRSFEVGRRGYEQQEVRAFLHEVSSFVERLLREEAALRERVERAESRLRLADKPDEAMLIEVLGEETTRVLTSAREAASEIKAKAEAAAERIVSESTAEAAEVRASAQQDADRRLAEATAEAETLRAQARTELERRSAEAEEAAARIRQEGADQAQVLRDEGARDLAAAQLAAEAAVEAARVQGKEMVAEAQLVRERVLRDLGARRKKARQQVEKLNAGRERLLEAYDVVRRTVDEATTELHVSLSDARLAADAAVRRLDDDPDPTLEQLDAEVRTAALVDLPITEVDPADDDEPGPFSGEVPAAEVVPSPAEEPAAAESTEASDPAPPAAPEDRRGRKSRRRKDEFSGLPAGELVKVEPPAEGEGVRILVEPVAEAEPHAPAQGAEEVEPAAAPDDPSEVDAPTVATQADEPAAAPVAAAEPEGPSTEPPEASGAEEADPTSETEEGDPTSRPAADDVFARLRAEQSDTDPATADASDEPPAGDEAPDAEATAPDTEATAPDEALGADHEAFVARDAALEPIEKDLARRLKRALADEQNEVLDLLRRAKPTGVDALLPSPAEHTARWAEVARAALVEAATAGAQASGGEAGPVDALAEELAQGLTAPLRERIDRSFAASDGNLDDVADRVRALYREWKGQRLVESGRHHVAAAYARGAFEALDASATVRWAADPSSPPCVDCDDNLLAGAIPKGEAFPTGGPCAPAHPGCRCLVLLAST